MEKRKALIERSEWWLWVQWVLASTAGGIVGGLVLANSSRITSFLLIRANLWELLGESVVAGLIWSVAGILQWLILRGRIRRPGRWVLASTAGSILGVFVSVPVLFVSVSLIYTIGALEAVVILWGVVTFVVGIAQWLILRRRVFQAGWWVLVSTVGAIAAAEVSWAMRDVVGQIVRGATDAALVGAVTGLLLVVLLRHPAPEGWNA